MVSQPSEKPQRKIRVFVSHSHRDDSFTSRLVADLRAAGAEVWVDTKNIQHGNFLRRINDGLERSDWLMLVLTPHAIASEYVADEVYAALSLVKQGRMRGVIPILAAPCEERNIPVLWSNLHRYDATRNYAETLAVVCGTIGLHGTQLRMFVNSGADITSVPSALDWSETQQRRLPMYLLLPVSDSMQGTKIVNVNNGVTLIYQELMSDPRSVSTVHISVITFAEQANQIPMVPITQFAPPQLSATGRGVALGGALHLLNESLDRDLIANQPGRKGDYKPLVFLLMDAPPTDHWEAEAERFHRRQTTHASNVIGLAIDNGADESVMRQICTTVLKMTNVSPENIRAFFEWVSESVRTASGR